MFQEEENTAIGTTIDKSNSIGHGSSQGDKSLAHQKSAPIMARNIEITPEEESIE